MIRTAVVALAGVSLVVALAACGKQGDLDRPDRLWGPNDRAEYSAQQRAHAAQASNAAEANAVSPPQNPALEPYTTTAPTSQAPIPGQRVYPSGAPQTTGP
jgi:predicted small lipoprotein YifL